MFFVNKQVQFKWTDEYTFVILFSCLCVVKKDLIVLLVFSVGDLSGLGMLSMGICTIGQDLSTFLVQKFNICKIA